MADTIRMTVRNPNGTYRVPIERINNGICVEVSGHNVVVFGEIVNRLGRLEDKEELETSKKDMSNKTN